MSLLHIQSTIEKTSLNKSSFIFHCLIRNCNQNDSIPDTEAESDDDDSNFEYYPRIEEKEMWDCFVTTKLEESSSNDKHKKLIKWAHVTLKIFTAIITSLLVLLTGLVSKGTLFFMAAQMKSTKDVVNGSRPLKYCSNLTTSQEKGIYAGISEEGIVAWHWFVKAIF